MPIHDQTYRRYEGKRQPRGGAWAIIASAGIRTIIRKRLFLGLLLLAWLPFLIRAVLIYASISYPQLSILNTTRETFHSFLDQQGFFVFMITIWVGSGLIAKDRRANALQIYLSKPLTRAEYIAGKLMVLGAFLLMVTWLPAMMLLLLQMLFAGSFTFIRANLFLFPAITVYAFLQVLLISFAMLALSSLSKSARYASVLYAGVYFFTAAVFGVTYAATGSSAFSWLSFDASLRQLGNVIFRQPPQYDTPWEVSLLVVLGVMALCLWVLDRRVRGVEVVK
jgi:ABC-2 type transport system permease protein